MFDKIISLFGISLPGYIFNQTDVSLSMLSHEEREKRRSFGAGVLIVIWGVVVFVFFSLFPTLMCELFQEKYNESFENVVLWVSFALLAILVVIFILLSVVEIKKIKCEKKEQKIAVMIDLTLYKIVIGCIIFCLFYFSFSFPIAEIISKQFLFYFLFAVASGVPFYGYIYEFIERLRDECASIKMNYKGKEIFIFEKEGDAFICGDNEYINKCTRYWYLSVDEVKGQELFSVRNNVVSDSETNTDDENETQDEKKADFTVLIPSLNPDEEVKVIKKNKENISQITYSQKGIFYQKKKNCKRKKWFKL